MIKKTVSAILVIAFIFALCVVSTYAAVSYSTSVNYYGPGDTQANATMTATGGTKTYAMNVWIRSHSTGDYEDASAIINNGGSSTLSTARVNIDYPNVTEYPVVEYDGFAVEMETESN